MMTIEPNGCSEILLKCRLFRSNQSGFHSGVVTAVKADLVMSPSRFGNQRPDIFCPKRVMRFIFLAFSASLEKKERLTTAVTEGTLENVGMT